MTVGFQELSRKLISHYKQDVGFFCCRHYIYPHENIAAGFDPRLSAYTIILHGARMPLFADMFRLCATSH
jgi:hypothetical protein